MAELRIDPLTGDFIVVNDRRMERPIINEKQTVINCPFCATSSRRHPGLPLTYEAIAVDNLYPSLLLQSNEELMKNNNKQLFVSLPNIGKCEVILYTSNHDMEFYNQPDELTTKIMLLWQQRYNQLKENEELKYIFIFENRGEAVGVTIPHPHGQLYALPVVPPIIKRILKRYKKWYKNTHTCLQCSIIKKEQVENIRIIDQNEFFIALVPYCAKMLYEVQIIPLQHHSNIESLSSQELKALGIIIKSVRKKYDLLFKDKRASFMMMLYNSPINADKKYVYFHMYLQFVCLDRDNNNLKYRASMETGLYFWTNDSSPEKIADEFRSLEDL